MDISNFEEKPADVFISYSSKDRSWVQMLSKAIESQGYSVWWDTQLLPSHDFEKVIEERLAQVKCAIVVWSGNSINSDWVRNEAAEARKRGILIPVYLQVVEPPLSFRNIHITNLKHWRGDLAASELTPVITAISDFCNKEPINPPSLSWHQKHRLVLVGVLLVLLVAIGAVSQWSFSRSNVVGFSNLDFEEGSKKWDRALSKKSPNVYIYNPDYLKEIDYAVSYKGNASAHIRSLTDKPSKQVVFPRIIEDIEKFKGNRIKISAYVKTIDIEGTANLFIEIHGVNSNSGDFRMISADDMSDRLISGSTDWTGYDLIVDVPLKNVAAIDFGFTLNGSGKIWVDDFKFEIIDKLTPITETRGNSDNPKMVKNDNIIFLENLDFENGEKNEENWSFTLSKKRYKDYYREVDNSISYKGKASGHVRSVVANPDSFTTFSRYVSDIKEFKGNRVRLSAYVKTESVDKAGLWMRVDGIHSGTKDSRMFGLDNMLNRALTGTNDWKKIFIVMDVPDKNTTGLAFGLILDGKGKAWVDNFKFEVVDESMPVTEMFSDPDNPYPYIDNGDGTVADKKNKLIWKKCSEGQNGKDCSGAPSLYDYSKAKELLENKSDWRLPTIQELKTLVFCSNEREPTPLPDQSACGENGTYESPTILSSFFPHTATSPYWSSSDIEINGTKEKYAMNVNFSNGYADYVIKSATFPVRLIKTVGDKNGKN